MDTRPVSFSTMKFMGDCPLEYLYRRNNPTKQTPVMLKGNAFHAAVLQPDIFKRDYARKSDKKSGDQAQKLPDKDYDDVLEMRRSFERIYGHVIGKVEKEICWVDGLTGLSCKGRIDNINIPGFTELKAVSSAYMNPDKFGWHCVRMQWDVQMAFYHDGLELNGIVADPVILIVVQQTAPYDVVVYDVPHYVIEDGRAKYLKYLLKIKECRELNSWPGRCGNKRLTLVLPHRFDFDSGEDIEME